MAKISSELTQFKILEPIISSAGLLAIDSAEKTLAANEENAKFNQKIRKNHSCLFVLGLSLISLIVFFCLFAEQLHYFVSHVGRFADDDDDDDEADDDDDDECLPNVGWCVVAHKVPPHPTNTHTETNINNFF